ncbi:MAG: 1-(5-phosphoribosyl)-5-[(5-phosphoribosylamino)methylideneamino]imidazole-4-carboxamide isomerase [Gammaproteobacteria bacterium]|nr:1-(5-phosphoribosyl)-5-[(5-phosphoribosylamino)methylideneamino]imidazole-4-carboxamide isomerase [Gammaproteobacteria bacterium]
MLLIPAIDLKDGKCVRLRQGDMNQSTIFSDNPVAVADQWVEQGARRLHIVDLDGAIEGEPRNADVVHNIARRHPNLPIQIGGGIRTESTVGIYIQAGVRFVIIGTQAIKEPDLVSDLCAQHPSHIIVGLDAKDGKVATEGWAEISQHNVIDIAQRFENDGIEAIIYTDIARDGMMSGVNIEATVALAEAIDIPVIASGGIHDLENVKKLASAAGSGIVGAITGRAIYEGTLDFAQGQKSADEITRANARSFGL